MLLDLNGAACEVVTGVSLGTCPSPAPLQGHGSKTCSLAVYPILTAPGYAIKYACSPPVSQAPNCVVRSIDERTIVHFANNSEEVLTAYVDNGEGIDRAGGFAAQGLGGMLVSKVDGDYHNVAGFPASSFFKFLDKLVDEEDDFLMIED